jgi:integrating conjugative element protein (TIGR03757 family)
MQKYITLCIAILAMFASAGSQAQEILVFTDSQYPVLSVPEQAQVFELNRAGQLEVSLSDGLNADQAYSAELARSRLNASTHRQLAQAYRGNVDAWSLGVQKIPAVVVDRQYVIYGEPDVEQAVSRIQAYREGRP